MSIITISRRPYCRGKEIAEKLAKRLGYECISRDNLVKESEHFNIPGMELIRSLHHSHSFLDRFLKKKDMYFAFIRESMLEHLQRDNIVYHGMSGHFFVKDVKNILKVEIIANMEDRVAAEMDIEKLTWNETHRLLEKNDNGREKWSRSLYGMDISDPNLFDIILHLYRFTVHDAVDILYESVQRPGFQTTEESKKKLADLFLSARVQSALVGYFPKAGVVSNDGAVDIRVNAPRLHQKDILLQIKFLLRNIEDINDLKIHFAPMYPQD